MAESFTVEHFADYAGRLVYEDGSRRAPEPWQLEIAADVFAGYPEVWEITPEANGKSTFIAMLALYGADYASEPWIPVGAAAAQQAKIIYTQATGFVVRTPGLRGRFKCLDGYKLIRSLRNGGVGIQIYAHDPKTGDGVIPHPYAILDELHRHPDLRLYGLWKGKLRKRGAQLLAASTAGEPNSAFENLRNQVRDRATKRHRDGAHLRAEGGGMVLHEWMVQSDAECDDLEKVKEANPLSSVTVSALRDQYDSPTRDDGDWKRLKCNRPARGVEAAITEKEWDAAEVPVEAWDDAKDIFVGLDWAPKWDTTALVPLWRGPEYRLLGPSAVLIPPRDGTLLHPDKAKDALIQIGASRNVLGVVMDPSRALDIAAWIEDELGITVVEWGTSNSFAVEDFNSMTEGLRNGTLKHTGDPNLRAHAMNAAARRLPGGDYRFDRPSGTRSNVAAQDLRVIDALTAAGMVVSWSNRDKPKPKSRYEDESLATV